MKIYKTIQEAKENKITSLPGIYYFRNKINNKYYIGQAISIRDRFKAHCYSIKIKANYPIYNAINKYGENNFEYGIIGVFKSYPELTILKKKLDLLEIKYIEEYNSFGSNGYNQTLGGDGGILGYKMTEEQKKYISENAKKRVNDGRYTIYLYDLKNNIYYKFSTLKEASEELNVSREALYSALRRKFGIALKQFLVSKNKEELEEYIANNNISPKINSGQFKPKLTVEEYLKIRNENKHKSANELAKILNVCKKTIYNYESKLPEELQIFKKRK